MNRRSSRGCPRASAARPPRLPLSLAAGLLRVRRPFEPPLFRPQAAPSSGRAAPAKSPPLPCHAGPAAYGLTSKLLSRRLQTGVGPSSPLLRPGHRTAANGELPRPPLPQRHSSHPVLTCPNRYGLIREPPASFESPVWSRCHEPPYYSVDQSRPDRRHFGLGRVRAVVAPPSS